MKYFKKSAIILVLILVLLAGGKSMAVQATEPTSLPIANQPCSITIQKHAVEDLSQYEDEGTGEAVQDIDLPTIANIDFTVTRVKDEVEDVALAEPLEGEGEYSKTIPTDNDGVAYFGDLVQGVYLIHEETSSAVHSPVDDFLVTLPMTNPTGNGWLYDVFVYPKNVLIGQPDIEFHVGERGNKYQSLDVGSTTKWIVEADVPRDIGSAKKYQITASLNAYLSIENENNVTVYAEDNGGIVTMLKAQDDYTATVVNNELVVGLTSQGHGTLNEIYDGGEAIKLYTEFNAALLIPEEDILEAMNQEVSGNASLIYTNSLNTTIEAVISSSPYVFTGGFHIVKTNNDDQLLSGAKFRIYRNAQDAGQGANAVENPYTGGIWEVTTDDSGEAHFYGLAYGGMGEMAATAVETYYLVETQAPNGYNLLTAPVEVTVDMSSLLQDNYTSVVNRTGFTLPVTGGVGIALFLSVGALLVGGAVLLLKKANKKNIDQ